MNTYIVNESSKNIRALARQSLKGQWKPAILAVLIYALCTMVPPLIITALFGGFSVEYLESDSMTMPGEGLSSFYAILVGGAFAFGLTVFFLDLVRENKTDLGSVFSGFSYYFKTLLLYVVMSIFIVLWSILLIVPGIIAAFRYSQAFYILADDPSKDIMQCLRESKEMMKGNKGKYCCLMLSFIGWYVLAIFAALGISVVAAFCAIIMPDAFATMATVGISAVISVIMTIIVVVLLIPYIQSAATIFYEMVNGNLRPASEDLPPLSRDGFEQLVNNNQNSENQDEIRF